MAVIGNLVANLVADTSGFTRPMIAAGAVVGNVSSAVASAAGTAAGGFGKLATSSAKASIDVSRGMANIIKSVGAASVSVAKASVDVSRGMAAIIKSVGAASASVGVGFAKAVAVTRESGAKVASIQAKTEAQLQRQQARMMKGAVSGGVLSGMAQFTAITYALKSFVSGVSGMVTGAIDAQKSGAKLDSVLASTGGAAGVTGDEIRRLAGDLQLVTDFEDDATIAAAGVLATFTQIKGDVFKQAIVSAQNLSAVMGQDLQSSVVQIGKALNDPIKGISALSRVGVSFSEQQKAQITQMAKAGDIAGAQAIILRELQTEFGGAAEAMSSPFTRIGNIVGDVAEGIGSVFLPSLEAVASMITSAILPVAEGMGERFAAAGLALRDFVVPAMQVAATVVANLGTYLDLLGTKAVLAMVQAGNAVTFFFTDQLPVYFQWFLDNWGNLWTDALSITQTAFANLGTNIASNMAAIWDYISSGGATALEMTWTPLLTGFESTVGEIPKIAERIPSEMEKTLGDMVGSMEAKLATDMESTMEGIQKSIDKKPLVPSIKKPESPDGTIGKKPDKAVKAAQKGTKEALSAIFGSMRGEDYQRQLVALQQHGLTLQQKQLDALDAIANDEGIGIED